MSEEWTDVPTRDSRFKDRQSKAKKHFEKKAKRGAPIKKKGEGRQDAAAAAAPAEPNPLFEGYPGKEARKAIARDTLDRLEDDMDAWKAYNGTVVHDGPAFVPVPAADAAPCRIVLKLMLTLQAVKQLVEQGIEVCALNFASAKNPGGGVLKGSSAQEESLCKSSGLYWCLYDKDAFYDRSRKDKGGDPRGGLYYDTAIYSPMVPIIKDDFGKEVPRHLANFLTVAAVNRSTRSHPHEVYDAAMARRCELVLNIAASHGQRTLVLGAFGCGVFKNNVNFVAKTFAGLLKGKYARCFDTVLFAIPDPRFLAAFKKAFE